MIDLTIGGTSFDVGSLRGHVGLSALFRFDVHAQAYEEAPPLAGLVGETFFLALHDSFGFVLEVRGVVTACERSPRPGAGPLFTFTLEPEVAPLRVGSDSRVFQEQTVEDIVKDVLDRAGVPADHVRWATTGTFAKRPYTAQYQESDWTFIERLLAEEGIYTCFDFVEGKTTLVLADDSTAAEELPGGAEIPYADDDALRATRDFVIRVKRRTTRVHDAVRLRDYNFDKPRLTLDSKAGSGDKELFDFPGRFAVPADGDERAQRFLDALRAERIVTSGESGSLRLVPGLVLELTEHPFAAMNGRLLVLRVEILADDTRGAGGEGSGSVRVQWAAIPADVPYRPARKAVTATPRGPQTGIVVGAPGSEIHPDRSGRVRVQHYWDREGRKDDKASTWMRVGQFPLGGSMIMPRIGWDMLVGHHEGDVDQPFVMTHLYDGEHPVPYSLPANKTRTAWQTATTPGGGSTNEIRFEDKAGSEEMFINSSKDMNVVVGDNKAEKVGNNYTHSIGASYDVKVSANQIVGVVSNQDVSIGASESVTVSGGRSMTVNGSETSSIGASRSVTVSSGQTLEAKGGRTLTVGGSMMAASALEISRTAIGTMSVTVGGSAISVAATGMENTTGGALAETVGGAKIQAGAAGCETSVKGAAAETVGGAYVVAAGGNASEAATGALAITVGGAFLANAPAIEIEGDSEISVRVGGSSLVIKSSSIEVKAPTLASPAAVIDKQAGKIEHN